MRSTPARVVVTDPSAEPVTVLVGGVSELYQSDLDLGRVLIDRLQGEDLGQGVLVEELHYGAVAVAQRLEDLRPARLVLVSAVVRGRKPGSVVRSRIEPPQSSPAQVQALVGDAVTGYVHPDLVVEIAAALGFLPSRSVAIEVEPEVITTGEGLSASAQDALEVALDLVRVEVRRAPLLALADDLRPTVVGDRLEDSPALLALRDLLGELELLEREGRWGHTFAQRDRMKLAIGSTNSSEGMDPRDWALWWMLIEELDRLEAVEAVGR